VNVARSLRHARRRARLTQRALAEAAGMPQSTVARIEAGTHVPKVDTLERLLAACGSALEVTHQRGAGVDRSQIFQLLKLTPDERLQIGARDAEALDRAGL
jgi:transcriptional regulator with XRE-family HTH domain